MRLTAVLALTTLSLIAAACSKPTQDKAGADFKAVGHEIGDAAKDVAATPAVKAVGDDIKQGASEAADKTGEVAKKAGTEIKEGAQKVGADIKAGADKAADKTDVALKKADAKVDAAVKK